MTRKCLTVNDPFWCDQSYYQLGYHDPVINPGLQAVFPVTGPLSKEN